MSGNYSLGQNPPERSNQAPRGYYQATPYISFPRRLSRSLHWPWDRDLGTLSGATIPAIRNPGGLAAEQARRRSEICHVAFLLRQRTLPELVPRILDAAEFWASDRTENRGVPRDSPKDIRRHHEMGYRVIQNAPEGKTMLAFGPLNRRHARGRARKVVFSAIGHDQGWCSDPKAGNWTWFQARVADRLEAPGRDHRGEEEERLFENAQADSQKQLHKAGWGYDGQPKDVQKAAREMQRLAGLKEGDFIILSGHANFPGWSNYVYYAKIEVFYSLVR